MEIGVDEIRPLGGRFHQEESLGAYGARDPCREIPIARRCHLRGFVAARHEAERSLRGERKRAPRRDRGGCQPQRALPGREGDRRKTGPISRLMGPRRLRLG